MTSEAVFPNNQALTSALCGKYLKIHTHVALIPNEGFAIITTAITDHNSLLQKKLSLYFAMTTVSKTSAP